MATKKLLKNRVWDRAVKVEENHYYWRGFPLIDKRRFPQSANYKVIELFCGCGGTSKGFEMAGFDIVLGADIHLPSTRTFFLNHKDATVVLGDLRKIKALEIEDLLGGHKVDVTIAGVPCQGFSLNNRKRFAGDERNFLFKEYIRFVRVLQPKVVVLENVSGMNSTANGAFVEAIEEEIRSAGYPRVSHKMLNAADFGVPQSRQRLVFVATKEGIDFEWPKETHGPSGKQAYVTVQDAIGDLPSVENGQEVTKYMHPPKSEYQIMMRAKTKVLANHKAPNHPQSTVEKIAGTKQGQSMYPQFRQRIRLAWNKPSPTQVSGGIRPQFQFGHPDQARGLTIRERLRIQSFPDDFVVEGGIVQGRVQTGNAVPPLLAKAIALKIKSALNKQKEGAKNV